MKKILILTQFDNDATYYYRQLPLFQLNNPGIEVKRKPYHGDIAYSFFEDFTHLFLERPSGNHDLDVIKLAKQLGLKIITDWDDDCLHVDNLNPMWHHYKNAKATIMECLVLSDEVWVSTKSLKKAYSMLNVNIHVIPNCLNDDIHKVENKRSFNADTRKATWRGGQSHESDVYTPGITESLLKSINNHENWAFQFIGCRFIYLEMRCGKNYFPVMNMPLLQYFDYLNEQNPNLIFHPLQSTRFNESKSNIAFIEATYVGACFFGNKSLPEFNLPTIRDYNELDIHLSDDDRIEALRSSNERSWTYIQQNLLLSNVNKKRTERILAV